MNPKKALHCSVFMDFFLLMIDLYKNIARIHGFIRFCFGGFFIRILIHPKKKFYGLPAPTAPSLENCGITLDVFLSVIDLLNKGECECGVVCVTSPVRI